MKHSRRLSLPKLLTYVGLCLGGVILAVAMLILVFGNAILDRCGKEKAERAFADAHPRCALRIGELDYAVGANRLVAQSVTLNATNTTRLGQSDALETLGISSVDFLALPRLLSVAVMMPISRDEDGFRNTGVRIINPFCKAKPAGK
ncbi:MAG: ABC transporter permease [Candidatus Omnitrophica bacterium]|nr:ABC transporter permease [Candidatus Omnitrophota bacterium]